MRFFSKNIGSDKRRYVGEGRNWGSHRFHIKIGIEVGFSNKIQRGWKVIAHQGWTEGLLLNKLRPSLREFS
jgi:hypothetical protein